MRRKLKVQSAKRKVGTQSLKLLVLVFSFSLLVLSPSLLVAYAGSVSSTDLINNAKEFDAKTIVYEGEAIGDIMIRGEHAWVNLNDGQNAIGVWLDRAKAAEIVSRGNYKSKGDWLEITGIFNRACLEHGGDLDIHAQAMRRIKSGYPVTETINWKKINLAVFLFFILLTLWISRQLKPK
jgi:hypothetical protein